MQHLSGTTKSTATYATGYSSVGPAHHLPPPHPSSSNVIPVMVGYAHHQTASQGAFYGGGSSSGSTDYDKPTVMMAASSSKSVHHSPQLSQSFGHVSIRSTETAPITIDFEQQLKVRLLSVRSFPSPDMCGESNEIETLPASRSRKNCVSRADHSTRATTTNAFTMTHRKFEPKQPQQPSGSKLSTLDAQDGAQDRLDQPSSVFA